jgi:TolB protein
MDLYTIQVDGTQERRIIHDATPDAMPSWSADGTLLAFARGEPSQSDLYLIAPDGSGLEQVTDLDGYEQGPTWSPDGKRFAFIWGRRDVNGWGHTGELWVVDRDGSDLQQLRKEDTSNPAWSTDGRHIVFDSIEGDGHIRLLDLDTGIVSDLGDGFFPRWSPDGTRIVFGVLDDEGGSDVYIMMADGSDRTQLTSDPAFDTAPQWSPDGTIIIYWTTAPRGG